MKNTKIKRGYFEVREQPQLFALELQAAFKHFVDNGMKFYSNRTDAISDLHKQGFINDFQLFGNDLLWVQGKFFIRTGEFFILEYIKIKGEKNNSEFDVFGIIAPYHNIKGILLDHYKSYTNIIPPVLVKKLSESGIKTW